MLPSWPIIPSKIDKPLIEQWAPAIEPAPVIPVPAKKSSKLKFLGTFQMGEGAVFAIMTSTETYLSSRAFLVDPATGEDWRHLAKRTPYGQIPDEGTVLVEIEIDLEARIVTRMVYVTRSSHREPG